MNRILTHTDTYQKAPDSRRALGLIFGEGEAITIASFELMHIDHRYSRTARCARHTASSAGLHPFL